MGRHQTGACHKGGAHLLAGHEVKIAVAVARLHVGQAVPLLRWRLQRLGQNGVAMHLQANLTSASAEEGTGCAQEVSQVQVLQRLVLLRTQVVGAEVELELAGAIVEVHEAGLAHDALGGQASCRGHFFFAVGAGRIAVELLKARGGFLRGVGALEAGRIRIDAGAAQALQFG